MSDVEGLVRLMQQAADGLQEAQKRQVTVHGSQYSLPQIVLTNMAFSEAILRAVAASVSDPVAVKIDPAPGEAKECAVCGRKIGTRGGKIVTHLDPGGGNCSGAWEWPTR